VATVIDFPKRGSTNDPYKNLVDPIITIPSRSYPLYSTQNEIVVDYKPESYRKDFALVCSVGLNIGFLIGILMIL